MGMYPYSVLFGVHRDSLRNGESVGDSMLPHKIGAVGHKPTVLHPASQSEVQVHPDVVVQGPVIC